jgi:hypothetical protein
MAAGMANAIYIVPQKTMACLFTCPPHSLLLFTEHGQVLSQLNLHSDYSPGRGNPGLMPPQLIKLDVIESVPHLSRLNWGAMFVAA